MTTIDFDRNVYCMLGLPFDAVDMAGTVGRLRDSVARRAPCVLSTANLNWLIACQNDSQFRDSGIDSDLVTADGMPVVWMARLLGVPIRERVAGASLFEMLAGSGSPRLAVYFFGGKPGVAEAACRRLNAAPSGLSCAGFESPGFGPVEDLSSEQTLARINASGADFLVVSLGARKGQAWIARNRSRLSVPVISHLGAVVNFVAGATRRAPLWTQQLGMEWLWRIREEPDLWRRYASDGAAFLGLLLTRVIPHAWFMLRHRPARAQLRAASIESHEAGNEIVIRLSGAWMHKNLAPMRGHLREAVSAGKDVRIDLERVSYVDTAFVGLLTLLRAQQVRYGRSLRLSPVAPTVLKTLRYCCAEYLAAGAS